MTDITLTVGELKGELKGVKDRLDRIDDVLERIDQRTARLEAKENERKGAIAILMTGAGIVGGALVKLASYFFGAH